MIDFNEDEFPSLQNAYMTQECAESKNLKVNK